MNDIPSEDYYEEYRAPDKCERFYVAGPMRGIPFFNFPLFHEVTKQLRARGHMVFNPAERDNERYGRDSSNPTGDLHQAEREHGFNLRVALGEDLEFICKNATALVGLEGWWNSPGACAEVHTALALGIPIYTVEQALAL